MNADIHEIQRLANDYCWFADTCDIEGIVGLFAEDGLMDATAVGMTTFRGHSELREFYAEIVPLHEYSHHLAGTHRVDLDGDRATGTSHYLMHGAIKGAGPISAAGYFEDDYVRTADGWRFASRRGIPLGPPNISAMLKAMQGGVAGK